MASTHTCVEFVHFAFLPEVTLPRQTGVAKLGAQRP
jgi:hypothetical protein